MEMEGIGTQNPANKYLYNGKRTVAAMAEDITGADLPEASEGVLGSKGAQAFRNAKQFTHAGMIAIGGATATLGAGVVTAGEALTVTVVGAEFGIPAAVAGTGMMLGGSWMAANAMRPVQRNALERPSRKR